MTEHEGNAHLTEHDGRQLAIDMLRAVHTEFEADQHILSKQGKFDDLDKDELGDALFDAMMFREPDTIRRYLAAARDGGDAVERGFLQLLTDAVGSAMAGCDTDPERYEELLAARDGPATNR